MAHQIIRDRGAACQTSIDGTLGESDTCTEQCDTCKSKYTSIIERHWPKPESGFILKRIVSSINRIGDWPREVIPKKYIGGIDTSTTDGQLYVWHIQDRKFVPTGKTINDIK